METITNSVTYYSYGVGKGKSKVGGAPQMNSVTRGMPGCMRRPRGERGIPKLPIVAFHRNCKLSLLLILILRDILFSFLQKLE